MASMKFLMVDIGLLVASATAAVYEQGPLTCPEPPCFWSPSAASADARDRVVMMIEGDEAPSIEELQLAIAGLQLHEGQCTVIHSRPGGYLIILTSD